MLRISLPPLMHVNYPAFSIPYICLSEKKILTIFLIQYSEYQDKEKPHFPVMKEKKNGSI